MREMLLANVPTLILLGLFVAVVHLIKFIASRFWDFK